MSNCCLSVASSLARRTAYAVSESSGILPAMASTLQLASSPYTFSVSENSRELRALRTCLEVEAEAIVGSTKDTLRVSCREHIHGTLVRTCDLGLIDIPFYAYEIRKYTNTTTDSINVGVTGIPARSSERYRMCTLSGPEDENKIRINIQAQIRLILHLVQVLVAQLEQILSNMISSSFQIELQGENDTYK